MPTRIVTIGSILLTIVIGAAGCALFSVAEHVMPHYEKAKYSGLAGQKVGVLVWADRGIRMDWPGIQLDIATLVQDKLSKTKGDELKDATYPVQAASIVRYQRDHPEIEGAPVTEVAPKLGGITRLIYVEVTGISTRADASLQMFRGVATATVRVIEVKDGKANVAFEQADVRATFPPKSPEEGTTSGNDVVMYKGAIVALSQKVVDLMVTHELEP